MHRDPLPPGVRRFTIAVIALSIGILTLAILGLSNYYGGQS